MLGEKGAVMTTLEDVLNCLDLAHPDQEYRGISIGFTGRTE